MSGRRWHREAPPPEAYSRVTDAERFRPLHALALRLVEQLASDFEVVRADAFAPSADMQPFEHARPPVSLTPAVPVAAPLAIAFTTFPSVVVRSGWWLADAFPACGCDACDETATEEGERLEALVADVVAGRLREEITIPWLGPARLRWERGEGATRGGGQTAGGRVLPRPLARALRGRGPHRVQWQPWPRRRRGASGGAPASWG